MSSRDPPGTRSNSPTAPLPPPVIASAALRPDACVAEINCRHAASDGLMVGVWSELKSIPRKVKGGSDRVNRVHERASKSCRGQGMLAAHRGSLRLRRRIEAEQISSTVLDRFRASFEAALRGAPEDEGCFLCH